MVVDVNGDGSSVEAIRVYTALETGQPDTAETLIGLNPPAALVKYDSADLIDFDEELNFDKVN
jgi:hypothetical protein